MYEGLGNHAKGHIRELNRTVLGNRHTYIHELRVSGCIQTNSSIATLSFVSRRTLNAIIYVLMLFL